ncbi:MAG: general stress protein [Pelatocladus maniniholoensis HA4357-MV3]|jgi:hypothetical protein|uniref:General stress protein n=1 Tax=Pelatocladus maniniholoensis HA4357-MV3 TaxID=1117104 RepID=A0A9E3LSE3_9NOST|nr:general stress protein [Pelatocladus maniniholoensis HA4357-MV3]
MVVGIHRRAVGVFSHRRDAEEALHELRDAGFPMDRVSVVARDIDRNDQIAGAEVTENVGNKADEGAATGAVSGGVLGGLTGLLVGLGTLAIPGIGPIMLAGAAATTLATTIAGAGIGAVAGGLLGALIGLGIPEERARVYNERVDRGHYLVIIDGTEEEIARAEAILRRRGIEEFEVYDIPVGTGNYTATSGRDLGVNHKHAIGYFSRLEDAEAAIGDLRSVGFPLGQISLVNRNWSRRDRFAGVTLRDRFDEAIHNLRLRLPDHRSHFYHERINHGDYVVVVSGTDAEIQRAAAILNRHGIRDWEIFDPTVDYTATSGRNLGVNHKHAIGYFSRLEDAEAAIGDLRSVGFPLGQISLVNRNWSRRDRFAGVTLRDRFDEAIHNLRLRLPDHRSHFYHERINHGDYVVVVSGTDAEIQRAAAILNRHGIRDWEIFDPTVDYTATPARNAVNAPVSGYSTTPLHKNRRAIGAFSHHRDAEAALMELRDSGFPMNQVSLIAKDSGDRLPNVNTGVGVNQNNVAAQTKADEGAKAGAATGGVLGGLGGLLVGLGALAIPGVGPVIAGGAIATALATTVAGGAIGAAAGGLTGGLVGLGIPENRARLYSDRFNRGDYLVIVDGTDEQIHRAEAILKRRGITDFDIFDATDINRTHHAASVTDTSQTSYSPELGVEEPKVVIVDHREI